jgi:hypothetical protein
MRVLSLSPAVLVWCLIGCGGVQQAPCPEVAAAVEATAEATSQATATTSQKDTAICSNMEPISQL